MEDGTTLETSMVGCEGLRGHVSAAGKRNIESVALGLDQRRRAAMRTGEFSTACFYAMRML